MKENSTTSSSGAVTGSSSLIVLQNKLNQNVIYPNVRSFRFNFDRLLLVLNLIKYKISIIVLSEIWIGNEEEELYYIPGYNIFHRCNNSFRAGMLYIKGFALCNLNMVIITTETLNLKLI